MIKINIHIEADSVEEAKNALSQLGGETTYNLLPVGGEELKAPTPETKEVAPVEKKTRSRAAATPAEAVVATIIPAGDPLGGMTIVHPPADPLGAAPAPAGDPLAATAPTGDPLAATTTAPAADPLAPSGTIPAPAKPASISLQTIREKIGTLTEKKQQAKDLIATYKKADGSHCEKPSDIQESDYESVYNDLDYI